MTRYPRYRTEEMERIKIRERETSSDQEETRFYLLEVWPKLEVRELEMRRYGQRDIGQKLRLTKRERDESR